MTSKLIYNDNEFVLSDDLRRGVMGIPENIPDEFAHNVVKRYNSHDDLVNLLQEIRDVLPLNPDETLSHVKYLANKIDEALEKAKGE